MKVSKNDSNQRFSLLSATAILREVETGTIAIDPFQKENLGPNSYDVTMGNHFWREQNPHEHQWVAPKFYSPAKPHSNQFYYSPYSQDHVDAMWALEMAQPLRMLLEGVDHGSYSTSFSKLAKKDLEYLGIQEDDMGIILEPGESVLAHTQEFIGTFGSGFTSAMHARSSSGRNFLEVCRCAGLGDEGYFNRWTIELQNNSRFHHIPIIVGRRYAQMVFYQIEPNAEPTTYVSKGGKYQTSQSLEDLKETWDPVDMLPKMHRDREVIGNG